MSNLMTNNIYEYLREIKLRVEHMERRWVKTGLLDKVNEKIFHVDENGKDTLKWITRNGFGNIEDFLNKIDNVFNMQVDIIIKEEEEKERKEKEKKEREKQQEKPEFFNKIFNKATTYIINHLNNNSTQDFLFIELPPRHLKTTLCYEIIKHLDLKEFYGVVNKIMFLNFFTYKGQDSRYYDFTTNLQGLKKLIIGTYGINYSYHSKREQEGQLATFSFGSHAYNSFDLIIIDDLHYHDDLQNKNDLKEKKNYAISNITTWLKPNGIVLFVHSYHVPSFTQLTDLIKQDLQQFTIWKYPAYTNCFNLLWKEKFGKEHFIGIQERLGKEDFDKIYLLK